MNVTGGCLVVAFTESPSGQAALEFQRKIFEESIRRGTEGIVLDVSGVSLMDSLMSRSLANICQAGRILGKKTVVAGLKPAVAAALVDFEIDLSSINTAVNIEEAVILIHPPKMDEALVEPESAAPDEDAEHEETDESEGRETEDNAPE